MKGKCPQLRASKSKVDIMVTLCKPRNLNFRAIRNLQPPTPNSVFHICSTYPQSLSYLYSRRDEGCLDPVPAVLPAHSVSAPTSVMAHSPPIESCSQSLVAAITKTKGNRPSLTLICIFLAKLHPKSQDSLLWHLHFLREHQA